MYGRHHHGHAAYNIQMGMNPALMLGTPQGINQGVFYFSGNPTSFSARLDGIPEDQVHEIRQANITIVGLQTKQFNMCCLLATVIIGSFIIFPLYFLCCGWWQRMVYPAFEVDLFCYQALERLFRGRNLTSVTINVLDNGFNAVKANAIYQALSRSTIKGFVLVNSAQPFNYRQSEYDDFTRNVRPIKNLSMSSNMRWHNEIA